MNDPEVYERVSAILARADLADIGWRASEPHQALLAEPDAAEVALAIARDRTRDVGLRVRAYEAAHALGATLPDEARADAAAVYVDALIGSRGGHDAWGFPSSEPRGASGAGARIVALGEAALPALARALTSEVALSYEGSEEPTIAEMRRYRVKDLAATWVAAILGGSFDVEPDDPATRDLAIDALAVRVT